MPCVVSAQVALLNPVDRSARGSRLQGFSPPVASSYHRRPPCAPVLVLISAVVGVLLLVVAGAVYAYDRAHAEEIGEGRPRRRRRRERDDRGGGAAPSCARRVLEPLNRPVVVRADGKSSRSRRAGRRSPSTSTAPCGPRWTARARATCSRARGAGSAASRSTPTSSSTSATRRSRSTGSSTGSARRSTSRAVDATVDLESGDVAAAAVQGRRRLTREAAREPGARRCSTAATTRP